MTEISTPPPGGRVEPVGLEVEMQRSFLDYAMSVIVSRALPDVRDGLKPVHRRVLYAMYDGGYRPDRGYSKCSRVVGDVMGQYHPHGDSAIYDTLVRLAQPWSMRLPLVDGQGNFGSPGNDPPAAMRYCLPAQVKVALPDGSSIRLGDIVPDAQPNSDHDIDLKVVDRNGQPVRATKFFHSGEHPTLRVRTREGYEVEGTHNHPLLCLTSVGGVPTLLWKLMEEISVGDVVAISRSQSPEYGLGDDVSWDFALLAGAFIAEAWTAERRLEFSNTDKDYFDAVVEAYDRVVGGSRHIRTETTVTGKTLWRLSVMNVSRIKQTPLKELLGRRSADKRIPEFIWKSGDSIRRYFLGSLFTGDGSSSTLPRGTHQVSYSTRSRQLARDVQDMLLGFRVVSRLCFDESGEIKVVLTNKRDVRLFSWNVGFLFTKRDKLQWAVSSMKDTTSLSHDYVPHVSEFVRANGGLTWNDRDWLKRHNVDRVERWERRGQELREHIGKQEVLDVVEPLVDGRYYYAKVAAVEEAGVQAVYSIRVDSDDHSFLTDGFVSHNTESRLAAVAMEMLRDIDQETVDFGPNYDGRSQEPSVLPSRFPNLLVNGAAGIAVGMATNIPPHNLVEVGAAVQWALENPTATDEELLEACVERVHGPDFPTGALIVGRDGIDQALRTGRGSVRMRAVVEVEEDSRGRQQLVITELPYQVNPDALAEKVADLVRDGKVAGIADIKDDSSLRTGQRLVIVLKRDAIAKVVLNNLYKHTQLQDSFGVNMLALVDGVPRTLNIGQMVRYYVAHQVEIIVRRTQFRLRKAQERAHILIALLKAQDRIDDVIALIRASESAEAARTGLMTLLDIDEIQATAILDMQLRRLAALERQRLQDEHDELMAEITEYESILASEERQRSIIGEELGEIVAKHGTDRVSRIVAYEGDMSLEDLIAQEDVVVTITRGGYAKRTKVDLYRAQRRGGKGVMGAALKTDDIVEQFFVTSTHNWILFFTNKGRVYRAKAHELPETNRAARGQHVANLLAFQPDEQIASVMDIKDYSVSPYLVLATKRGLVKKTKLTDFDSNRSGGVVAINLREDDELIAARLVAPTDDLLLVSRNAQSIRFHADDDMLRPMGRATSGVIGMRFSEGDELLAMEVATDDELDILIATDGGFAKRTKVGEYPVQGRGGKGVLTAKIVAKRGGLVGALAVRPDEEIFAISSGGDVIRTRVKEVRRAGRQTMGVRLINLPNEQTVVAVARNAEVEEEEGDES
ncbi:MAG TPA: intein-containing DNA gyrase subunit A [Mycobacteriales bacterium]|nr:intein-containing DNA gyrase subunit A [Mycobacteriales bacterium]